MSDVKGMDDFAKGSRKSPYERDLRIAAELGARAAALELSQPGVLAGSHKIRHTFRLGVLNRYNPDDAGGDTWERERISALRSNLDYAYYSQPGFMAEVERRIKAERDPDVLEIDGHAEIVIPAQRTAELVSA